MGNVGGCSLVLSLAHTISQSGCNSLDSNDAVSIETVQNILSGSELEDNLVFISAHFSYLPTAITGTPLNESLIVFEETICNLSWFLVV